MRRGCLKRLVHDCWSTYERLEIAWDSLVVESDFGSPLHLLFNLCSGQFFETCEKGAAEENG